MSPFETIFQSVLGIINEIIPLFVKYREFILVTAIFGVFVLLIEIFKQAWLFHRRNLYRQNTEQILLEIKIPREVTQMPQAMEQFFMNIYSLRNAPGKFVEIYLDGEVSLWWSLEIVSFGGRVHFYIRTPKKYKRIVESALYSQYPTIEVEEVKDYFEQIPATTKEIYQKGYQIFGSELKLAKEDAYPITTYERFELSKEEMAMDPISVFIETLAGVHKEEIVCFQILIRPAGTEWQEAGKELIDKLAGRKKPEKKGGFGAAISEWIKNFLWAPVEPPIWGEPPKSKEEKIDFALFKLTPGEQDVIKAIEESISKPGFDTVIRYIYYAPIAIFNWNFAIRGLVAPFNQYASPRLNFFRNNFLVASIGRWIHFPYIMWRQRAEGRKQRILHNFRERRMPEELTFGQFYTSHPLNFNTKSKTFILNTAELATIFHVPTEKTLVAPHVKQVESKKMGPPAGLPIFEQE